MMKLPLRLVLISSFHGDSQVLQSTMVAGSKGA
jgi:hypothetical protein